MTIDANYGMLIATSLMALFALFSWITAMAQKRSQEKLLISQQKSQEKLLNKQNKIQQKQLQLALLKEKQEIREEFRLFVIARRDALYDVIYKCKQMSLDEFRKNNAKEYVIFMKLGDLFGEKLKLKADEILRCFEDILSFDTQQISKIGLFANGCRHPEIEKKVKPDLLETYNKVYQDNTKSLLKAKDLFSQILQEMNDNINQISENLLDNNVV